MATPRSTGVDTQKSGKHPKASSKSSKSASSGRDDKSVDSVTDSIRSGARKGSRKTNTSGKPSRSPHSNRHPKKPKGPGSPKRQGRDASTKSVQFSRGRFWASFGEPGNAFLRSVLGGLNSEVSAGWEFSDIAKACAKAKFESVQQLYESIAARMANDETYVDIADALNVPDRVFTIPTLLKAFDDMVAKGELKRWQPDVSQDAETSSAPLSVMGEFRPSTPQVAEHSRRENVSRGGTLSNIDERAQVPKRQKSWRQIKTQAGIKEQKSSTCALL
eukprot:m.43924 g.43924  ORF g.43924 m.43924 type:complete len:275 (-) comp15063_c0_seq2:137-961(-)